MSRTLTADLRDGLRDRFRDAFGDRLHQLILYGSHARGEATEDSDIDILVVLEDEVGREEQERLHRLRRDLLDAPPASLSVTAVSRREFATRNLPLFRNIRAEGELLLPEDDPVAQRQLRTHAYSASSTKNGMKPETEDFLERARQRLDTTRRILDMDDTSAVISGAYYAMFFAATAALNEADRAAKSHKGTAHLFYETYVQGGPLDEGYAGLFADAHDKRIEADYARAPSFTREEAAQWIGRAEDFVGAVAALLTEGRSPER